MLDLRRLRYLVVLAKRLSYSRAAEDLRLSQSALSRAIQSLESELGVRLLQRSTRRFAVTDVGTSVHRHAQSMLAEAQAAREAGD